jgi:type I restriction enzyme M protein
MTVGQAKMLGTALPNNGGTQTDTTQIANFIWGIADDVLRDVYVRGKYRDVILPMIVLRRLDIVLESTKADVLKQKEWLDKEKIVDQEQPLRAAAKQPFYNTSAFTLRDLSNRTKTQQLRSDFEHYLDGFSKNVQDIITNFEFRNQIDRLSKANALGTLIEKFIDPKLDLGGLDNHAMGSVFEELVRKFNEDNNEEAGEHWTPRDVVRLMANLIFRPIADQITSGTYLLYDAAIGTGGMLTVAEQTLQEFAKATNKSVTTHLYGQEINAETYAICKSDLLLSGEGSEADNVIGGPEWSTLSNDAFPNMKFDFMLSNPPYGKSWKTDLERMSGGSKKKSDITDPRFVVNHDGESDFSLLTRSSDGQMMFLANMVSKMKTDTALGSRIAEIHNGSSLFTGDAGQGESNVRRWVIESDLVEAIIQLPEKMFYNTGIATHIWVLTNRKPEHRKGLIQLIDAANWSTPLRKNLGQKNAELSNENLELIIDTFLSFRENENSKILKNSDFGYIKIAISRPLRLKSQLRPELLENLKFSSGDPELRRKITEEFGDVVFTKFASIREDLEKILDGDEEEGSENLLGINVTSKIRKRMLDEKKWNRDFEIYNIGKRVAVELGDDIFEDHNIFAEKVNDCLIKNDLKMTPAEKKLLLRTVSWRDENAPKVIKKTTASNKLSANEIYGFYPELIDGKKSTVQYEIDPELSDVENVPLNEEMGIAGYFLREIAPYAQDAWIEEDSLKTGYEISFTKHFFKPPVARPLSEVQEQIKAVVAESDDLISKAIGILGA